MNKRFAAVISAGALLICSCSTVKEARKIQHDETPRLTGEYTISAVDAGIEEGAVLSLEQLEAIALKCNPSMLQANLAVKQAEIALANAKAGYMPNISSSLGHNRSTKNNNRHHGSTRNSGSYSGGLNLNVTIYDFGRTNAAVKQAEESLNAAQKDFEQQQNTIIYNVRRAYYELKRAMELHEVAVESINQYKNHLDQVMLKKEIGESIKYDVLKAEVDYQNAKLQEISTANNVEIDWANLNLILGLAEHPTYSLGDSTTHEYTESAEELLDKAIANEPSLAALTYRIENASASIDAAIAELYPDFSFSFGASVSGHSPSLPWLWNLSSGLSLAETVFNGGRNLNSIRQSVISLQLARSRYAAAVQSAYSDIRKATLNAVKAKRSLEVAELTVKSAEENLDVINEKYKYGKATSVDRTDAQVSLVSAKAQAVNARFDYLEAQASIAVLIGD